MNPDDERAAFWNAVHTVDDRVTALEAVVRTRNEMMRDSIHEAVREAMPSSMLSDDERRWVQDAIKKQGQSVAFRRKVIESSAIWAVPMLILAALAVVREYAIAHGMWKP